MALDPLLPMEILKQTIELPNPWSDLEKSGFHQDLMDRVYAHKAWTERAYGKDFGMQDEKTPWQTRNARAFLAAMGKGFKDKFNRRLFESKPGDPYFDLKIKALNALDELSDQFGGRVSSVMWDSLAHLATRSEPEQKKSILKEADTLPHHYAIVDTMLHAMGKVYSFSLHVQSVFSRHTGMVLIHNCDCNCSLLNLAPTNGLSEFKLSTEQEIFEATQSLLTHQLAESELILNQKLPFEYTITKDAQEILGI